MIHDAAVVLADENPARSSLFLGRRAPPGAPGLLAEAVPRIPVVPGAAYPVMSARTEASTRTRSVGPTRASSCLEGVRRGACGAGERLGAETSEAFGIGPGTIRRGVIR